MRQNFFLFCDLWGFMMISTISKRGQTVIPAEIRRRLHLSPADRLEWVLDDNYPSRGVLHVVPVWNDPIEAFRGQGKGGAVRRLLAERR